MKSIQCKFFVAVLLLAASFGQMAGANRKVAGEAGRLPVDGPYVFHTDAGGLRVVSVDTAGRLQDQTYATVPENFTFDVYSDAGEKLFPVTLHPVWRPAWKEELSEKVLVISDPHADWACFVSLLEGQKVIDKDYRWIFGKNKLVIIGDVFDRGKDVLPIYWLIYKLENEAQEAGGNVAFLLGNHESMVLAGDVRYTDPKYLALADTLNRPYRDFWKERTELGHWLGTRNTLQVIGDNLFVHAGLSRQFLEKKRSVPEVNELMSRGLFLTKEERKAASDEMAFMFATYGPIWYRGMVHSADKYHPLPPEDLPPILDAYQVKRIFVGHTIFDDILTFYQYRVIAVNVDNEENCRNNGGRGVLIEGDRLSVIYDSGEKKPIEEK